jgi:hypothetical protein
MARRIEPSRKSPAERLEDLLAGHRETAGPAAAAKYLERALASHHSMPNAVKFFAWALLAPAAAGTPEGEDRALEALGEAESYLAVAKDELGVAFARERDGLTWLETGISLRTDRAEFDEAIRLCDLALALGYGRAYESKKNSLLRMV